MYSKYRFILILGDLIIFFSSLVFTLLLAGGLTEFHNFFSLHILPFSILAFAWMLIFFIFNFYSPYKILSKELFVRFFAQAMFVNVLLALILFYFGAVINISITPKTNLAVFVLIFVFLFMLWRWSLMPIVRKRLEKIKVLFIGLNKYDKEHALDLKLKDGTLFKIVGIIPDDENSIQNTLIQHNPNIVVVGNDTYYSNKKSLFKIMTRGCDVYNIVSFWEIAYKKIDVDHIQESWFLDRFYKVKKREFELFKRIFDFVFAFLFIVFLFIPLCFLIVFLKIIQGGSVFYTQKRIGKNGKIFTLYKFRTMIEKAEKNGAIWADKNDNRITVTGKILRHTHIDEFPQILNVLKGDMSFVGPRPERPEIIVGLEQKIPFYDLRHLVKPGITGWAQINYRYGSSVYDSVEKLKYDLYYVKNRNFVLDIKIMLKTLAMFVQSEGKNL